MQQATIETLAIIVSNRQRAAEINAIVSQHEQFILGRIGVPYREKHVSVIALLVEGSAEELKAFVRELSGIAGVEVKSTLAK